MWNNPVTTTPSIIQVDFGPWGENLPGDGEAYCGPTSIVMGLYWLSGNGFTQLAPAVYDGQEDPEATNLELVIAGLLGTSSEAGTFGMSDGIAAYLSACGIAPDQYTVASTGNPDLQWIAGQIAPNVAEDPDTIVLAQFSVGWYAPEQGNPKTLLNSGGHVLCPLTADLEAGTITINNAYPASFFDVPNEPSENPPTVQLAPLPAGFNLGSLNPPPSQDYSQVISGNKGNGMSFAILWGAEAWAISATALPSTASSTPATWSIDAAQTINTNGGILTVVAPLAGSGGFDKCGEGTLLLTNSNQLTGGNVVSGGVLASTQTSGTPFGSGTMTLTGDGLLLLAPDETDPLEVQIASIDAATLVLDVGGGMLEIADPDACLVTIGGNTDGSTPNIARIAGGTLVLAPGGGTAALGSAQQVVIAGSAGNLPVITNGIVAPYILAEDEDEASFGVFLGYDQSAGFQPASAVSSGDVGINNVASDAVYQVVDEQVIDDNATAQVAALEIDGGEIDGSSASLQVGSQASGDVAGLIMNGGNINVGTLAFGAAEGVIYTSDTIASTAINSMISGSAGLTLFGPGALTLTADNSASLSGTINVNSGMLIAANADGSTTGSGDVVVNSAATLEVLGIVGGAVSVDQSGVLYMSGGTVQGGVTIAAIGEDSSDPGGVLEGGGTIDGTATVGGVVQSGPDAAILEFTGTATIAGDSAIFWCLQGYYDDTTAKPGVYWNALQFASSDSIAGTQDLPLSLFLDFSVLGADPDGGDTFWATQRTWTFMMFPPDGGSGWWWYGNFTYNCGSFTTNWDGATGVVTLIWTPVTTQRTPDERRRAEAEVRLVPHGR